MEDSDTAQMSAPAQMLLTMAKLRKGDAIMPEDAAAQLTWQDDVIGEVPQEMRHTLLMCLELAQKDDGKEIPSLTQRFGREAVPEVMGYLFKQLRKTFPDAKDLRICANWKVADRRPFVESVLRKVGIAR